jgi:hypothetical protein
MGLSEGTMGYHDETWKTAKGILQVVEGGFTFGSARR